MRLLLLVLWGYTSVVFSSTDAQKHWTEASFSTTLRDVTVQVSLSISKKQLSKLRFSYGDKMCEVPSQEFEGITYPSLENVQLKYGQYFADEASDGIRENYELVRMEYGTLQFGQRNKVDFLFSNGHYSHRTKLVRTRDGKWRYYWKDPNKEEFQLK